MPLPTPRQLPRPVPSPPARTHARTRPQVLEASPCYGPSGAAVVMFANGLAALAALHPSLPGR